MRQKAPYLSMRVLVGLVISISCFILLMIRDGRAGDEEGETSGTEIGRETKTISRRYDPVVIPGDQLSGAKDLNPDLFGLYALEANGLVPIPYQVDQRDKEDKRILIRLKDKKQKPSQPFDDNDELVFMARDLGDRCSPDHYPPGWRHGAEIEIVDPLDQTRGWSYLFVFDYPPDRSERAYTRYLLPKEGEDVVDTDIFTIVFPQVDEKKADSIRELRIKAIAGGTGENIIDRNKIRVKLKLRFMPIKLNLNEDTIGAKLVAYRDGPIRIIRRTENYISLGLGLKSPGVFVEFTCYENIISIPVELDVPFNVGRFLSRGSERIGFDYNPKTKGSMLYNSLNLQGFLIDGQPSPEEEDMNHGISRWNVLTGPMGTVMRRSVAVSTSDAGFELKEYLIDNAREPDPPESFPGNFGHTYLLWDISNLRKGHYDLRVSVFIPPNFTWGDQEEYLKIEDHPLEVKTHNINAYPVSSR